MIKASKRSHKVFVLAAICGVSAFLGLLPDDTMEDIKGRPGDLAIHQGHRKVVHSERRYARNYEQKTEKRTRYRSANNTRLIAAREASAKQNAIRLAAAKRKAADRKAAMERIARAQEAAAKQAAANRLATKNSAVRLAAVQKETIAKDAAAKEAIRKQAAAKDVAAKRLAAKEAETKKAAAKAVTIRLAALTKETRAKEAEADKAAREEANAKKELAALEKEKDTEPVILEVTQQNLTLAFVNPQQQPATGLHLVARVEPQDGNEKTYDNLTTDDKGQVKLEKIVVPAKIELSLAPEQGGEGATVPAPADQVSLVEWDFANAEAASLLVLEPMGKQVATKIAKYPMPLLLASLRLPQHYALSSVDDDSNIVRREVVYEGEQPPIVVERTVVDLDIVAPAGSKVTTAALPEKELLVPGSGHLPCCLSLAALQEGPVPFRVANELPGGEAEAVIATYPLDPYKIHEVPSPELHLVRLTKMNLAGGMGVTASGEDVTHTFGNLTDKKNKNKPGTITPVADGSQWWVYPGQGVGVKLRAMPSGDGKAGPLLVERVRVLSPNGGDVGGVTVGSTVDEVYSNLGPPRIKGDLRKEVSDTLNPAAGTIDTYLDRGLRICHADGKVQWLEVTRPNYLLAQGTTAFVPRAPARLFVAGFEGNQRLNLNDLTDFKAYLRQLNSVQLVDSRDDADFLVTAKVTEFYEDKDKATGLIPFRYDCRTRLSYSVYDTVENRCVVQDKEVVGTAKADYTKGAALVGIVGGALLWKGGKLGGLLGGLLLGGGIYELHRAMQKAANRSPAIAARTAFNFLAQDLNRAADFTVRVTDIDYTAGRLQLNGGSDLGIHAGDEFQVSVGNTPLPYEESSRAADYYTAVVLSSDKDSSVCELRHNHRTVKKYKESFDVKPDPAMLKHIPDPVTGLVSARARVNFPDVTVISDQDVQLAVAQIEKEKEAKK